MFDQYAAIEETAGKGFGVFAKRKVAKGECILVESPIFVVEEQCLLAHEQQLADFKRCGCIEDDVESKLVSLLEVASAECRSSFWLLCDSFTYSGTSACGILLSNGIGVGSTLKDSGIFSTGSRFNHSCLPNMCYSWQEESNTCLFHAACEIEQGQELTLSYISAYMPTDMRQQVLMGRYKFECMCYSCSLDTQARAVSDARRCRMCLLDKKLAHLLNSASSAIVVDLSIELALELSKLVDDELQGNPKLKACAYYTGLQLATSAGCSEQAQQMLEKMRELVIFIVGEDGVVIGGGDMSMFAMMSASPLTDEEDAREHQNPHDLSDRQMTQEQVQVRAVSQPQKMKDRFKNREGLKGVSLTAEQLYALLRKGSRDVTESTVASIFRFMGKDIDSALEFDELVDYLYAASAPS